MPKEYRIVLLNVVICCAFFACGLLIAGHAHAQSSSAPGLPFQLYGKVTTENGLIVSGASVEAKIKGVVVARAVTNTDGYYGLVPSLLIISDAEGNSPGETVILSINCAPVAQTTTFEPGVLKE